MTPKPDASDNATPKKHYEAPRLEIYGDIHEITQNIGTQGKRIDNGAKPRNKTA